MVNNALRKRNAGVEVDRIWRGYLFYLLRALDMLPPTTALVFRGGNIGFDQKTVAKDYHAGRQIQWAAFSSTSIKLASTLPFVKKSEGVMFRIQIFSGRDIGAYSYLPSECEILLSPNTRFTVTRGLHLENDGYMYVDLVENRGNMLAS